MEELRHKYILLQDRVGQTVEKGILTSLGLSTKSSPTQVLRGELLEALPEPEQPQDSSRIALVGIDRKSLRLECGMEYLKRLSEEEANLLLAISSLEARYLTFTDRIRLDFGRKLSQGSKVYVSVKGFSKTLPGVVWHKGELPSNAGTMFGVELIDNPGQGTSDGTFRNKRYFSCTADSGVFVGLDKLTPRHEDDDSKSPKRGVSYPHIITSRIKETVMSSFSKGKNEPKSTQGSLNNLLVIGQRVVTYLAGEQPKRGTVRYIAEEKDHSGQIDTIVGLELDTMDGNGTGKLHGKQRFVCRKHFAVFVPIEAVIPEKDFDEVTVKASTRRTSEKCETIQQQIHKDELLAKSLSYDNNTSDGGSAKRVRRASSVNSADHDVIMAAGESSQTDPTTFIEEQQKMLYEFNSSKVSSSRDNDVIMHDAERTDSATSKLNFEEEHFRNTPLDNPPVTKQPSLSGISTTRIYSGFVNIEWKEPYETGKHVMHPDAVMEGDTRTPLVTEHVSDCSPGASNRPEDQVLSKEPLEHLSTENALLYTNETTTDKTTDLEVQTTVDFTHDLEVGSMVEVPMAEGLPRYGVIKWIGSLPTLKDKLVAGLELEDEQSACSDGTFNGERYFTCPAGRGFFTLLKHCRQDSRFTPNSPISDTDFQSSKGKAFGSLPSPDVEGVTVPPQSLAENHCGTMRGLQGHHNSCYLDATLYSMFAFSWVFDTLLHREKKDGDLPEYNMVQHVLRESIVNPLRVHGFVRADRILQLRELLDKLSSTAGLVNEEKDPEEFLNSLLQQVLKAEPFLHLKSRHVGKQSSEGAFFYQIITEKDEAIKVAQVQQLLEQSFLSADIILSEVPSCLILQMPRFGSRYKMYDMILPNLQLDITHIVENVPRECAMCGKEVAQFECKMCYQKGVFKDGPGMTSYCAGCNSKVHSHRDRVDHKPRPFLLPRQCNSERTLRDMQKMDLFAVVCIETSHYVAFVKCGVGVDAPWCFFDSMADRKGEKNGYNIPAVTRCPEALEWLSKEPKEIEAAKERGDIPVRIRRLLGDGYLCMYQNLDMTMYK